VAFYLMVALVLSLGRIEPAEWVTKAMLTAYDYAFGVLTLFTVLTLKFTRRKKDFKATPMDFLILVVAIVVPNLPGSVIGSQHMRFVAVKLIVLYFGFEVLIGEFRGRSQQDRDWDARGSIDSGGAGGNLPWPDPRRPPSSGLFFLLDFSSARGYNLTSKIINSRRFRHGESCNNPDVFQGSSGYP
jgi:hypothetical protein